MPTTHGNEKEAKEDKEAYEEVTSTLRGLLNKYKKGKNRYQNLHRMMNSRTYPISISRGGEEVQDKTEGGTKQNDNLQVEKKKEEKESMERPDKDGDRNKILARGGQVIQRVQKGLHRLKSLVVGQASSTDSGINMGDSLHGDSHHGTRNKAKTNNSLHGDAHHGAKNKAEIDKRRLQP